MKEVRYSAETIDYNDAIDDMIDNLDYVVPLMIRYNEPLITLELVNCRSFYVNESEDYDCDVIETYEISLCDIFDCKEVVEILLSYANDLYKENEKLKKEINLIKRRSHG